MLYFPWIFLLFLDFCKNTRNLADNWISGQHKIRPCSVNLLKLILSLKFQESTNCCSTPWKFFILLFSICVHFAIELLGFHISSVEKKTPPTEIEKKFKLFSLDYILRFSLLNMQKVLLKLFLPYFFLLHFNVFSHKGQNIFCFQKKALMAYCKVLCWVLL